MAAGFVQLLNWNAFVVAGNRFDLTKCVAAAKQFIRLISPFRVFMFEHSPAPPQRYWRMKCNMGVWNESIAKGDLMSGSFVGLRLALMPRACTTRKSSAQSSNILMRLLRVETVVGLLSEINRRDGSEHARRMTLAQLCDHFEQRELTKENTWRSHATKKIYKAYLNRWVRPHWEKYELAEVRTIQVEAWLRTLPLAKSSCAKVRNLMSVLFNHACRCELFDRNPIYLVRQSAKRRKVPIVLMPAEIKALVNCLGVRERT
jgi:hypothetical protein